MRGLNGRGNADSRSGSRNRRWITTPRRCMGGCDDSSQLVVVTPSSPCSTSTNRRRGDAATFGDGGVAATGCHRAATGGLGKGLAGKSATQCATKVAAVEFLCGRWCELPRRIKIHSRCPMLRQKSCPELTPAIFPRTLPAKPSREKFAGCAAWCQKNLAADEKVWRKSFEPA